MKHFFSLLSFLFLFCDFSVAIANTDGVSIKSPEKTSEVYEYEEAPTKFETFVDGVKENTAKAGEWIKKKTTVLGKWLKKKLKVLGTWGKKTYKEAKEYTAEFTAGLLDVEDEYKDYEASNGYEDIYIYEDGYYKKVTIDQNGIIIKRHNDEYIYEEDHTHGANDTHEEVVEVKEEEIEVTKEEDSSHDESLVEEVVVVEIEAEESEEYSKRDFDHIVKRAFNEDQSCQNVTTGNMCRGKGCVAKPTLQYAKVLGRAFLDRICKREDKVLALIKKAPKSKNDALTIKNFSLGATNEESIDNAYATFSLLYTLGYRESHGDFLEGRDKSASNTHGLTEEAGFMQFSANMMIGKGSSKELMRNIMKKYVHSLTRMNRSEKANFCATDLAGNKTSKGRTYDPTGRVLDSEFNRSCSSLINDRDFKQSPFPLFYKSDNFTTRFSNCFKVLQKHCPAMPVELGAVMVRTERKHNGPLWTKSEWQNVANYQRKKGNTKKANFYETFASQKRPYVAPACKEVFVQLEENKESLCKNY